MSATLTEVNEAMAEEVSAPRPDRARIFDLDDRFHDCYMTAAGPRVLAMHGTVKPQAVRYERLYVTIVTDELQKSVTEHRVIIRAIRAGNAPAAQAAVENNWRNAAERLAGVVAEAGERGRW